MGGGLGRGVKFLAVALALGAVAVIPGRSEVIKNTATGTAIDVDVGGPTTSDPNAAVSQNDPGKPIEVANDGLQCTRGKNGGATDVGVTGDKIRLASTVVKSGPGASFLSDSPFGMEALVRKVNSAGGICGRLIDLKVVDDGWDAARGLSYIKNFIAEKVFALAVVPSSEGLTAAIEAGEIDKAKIPVVGTDGMLRQQYDSPWVWPVATATVSSMRIMAKHAFDKGSRCFGIVYDTRYRFGSEGADAFRTYVKKLAGGKVCADVGIFPARASYSSEIQRFNSACDDNGGCDFVAMLLEPATALTWIAGRPRFGTKMTSGAQTLFNEQFASNCGKACNGMLVWTGYNPPIGNLAGLPDVGAYVNDVKTVSPTVDTTNQFLEGAYLGMTTLIDALKEVGPSLTRARLAQVLNSKPFTYDIASPLHWTGKDRHANKTAQAFSIVIAQGSFAGFRDERTGFIKDPLL